MIVRADARRIPLQDETIDCVVTSPPYWGLRDYGVVGQIGLERSPAEYVAEMVEVFREVRRVLKPAGTLWMNLGDSYAANPPGNMRLDHSGPNLLGSRGEQASTRASRVRAARDFDGLKIKDLIGIPWRVAFALRADGWWLRSDIVWAKPNPMPESVTDRPTRAHEYVFLMSKSERYWYDADAIAEPSTGQDAGNGFERPHRLSVGGRGDSRSWTANPAGTRNARSVWNIATQPYSGAHFATFPEELARRCICAGCPTGGLVLDPFAGSGTVGKVAVEEGRGAVLCDLAYQDLAKLRTMNVARPLPL